MGLLISDDILQAARMHADELKVEIAVLLFQKEKLTLGQASKLAGMSQFQFQHLLMSRQISVHYGIVELEQDVNAIESLKLS